MSTRELFGIVVRGIGLWIFVQGIMGLTAAFIAVAMVSMSNAPQHSTFLAVFCPPVVEIIVGGLLLFGANGLVETIYGTEPTPGG